MSDSLENEVLSKLRWRYAVKKFDPSRTIPPTVWSALEDALVLTPSSFGLQPWKFFVVSSPEIKAKLPSISWGQTQPRDCSHMVVFAIRTKAGQSDVDRYVSRIAEVRGQSVEALAGFRKMMLDTLSSSTFDVDEWATRQVYIALGQFMAAAAVLGIDTCPMEGIDPKAYDELLGLTAQGYHTVVACAAGFRATDDKNAKLPKVRFRTEEVIQRI